MEAEVGLRPGISKNLIPAPIVTVRSEFPSLNRSRQQQPLTCLVTVEVPGEKWSPDSEQIRQSPGTILPAEDAQSLAVKGQGLSSSDAHAQEHPLTESEDMLSTIAEDLRLRVDNWHGLEFSRYVLMMLTSPSSFLLWCRRYKLVLSASSDRIPDSASSTSTEQSAWAKTKTHGKSWSATFSPTCSSA